VNQVEYARGHGAKRRKKIRSGRGGGAGKERKSLLLTAGNLPNTVRQQMGGNDVLQLVSCPSIKTIDLDQIRSVQRYRRVKNCFQICPRREEYLLT